MSLKLKVYSVLEYYMHKNDKKVNVSVEIIFCILSDKNWR